MAVNDNELNEKIQIILRQTNYTECEAREKLVEYNLDYLAVIKSYFGITEKKTQTVSSSLNQEIYKQLRYKMDGVMRTYNDRVEKGEARKL